MAVFWGECHGLAKKEQMNLDCSVNSCIHLSLAMGAFGLLEVIVFLSSRVHPDAEQSYLLVCDIVYSIFRIIVVFVVC